jgi:telomerase Cajal body protein 1
MLRPVDLLDDRASPHKLKFYNIYAAPEPIYSTAIYPFFSLQDPATALTLASPRDHPISLLSLLPHPKPLIATYPLIHPNTEKYLTPSSLVFTTSGTHFITGTDSLITRFDLSRPGSGPVDWLPTIPSRRKKIVGGGVGIKGVVSAMALDAGSGMLAVGTWTRMLGLYGNEGAGEMVAVFSIDKNEAGERRQGGGISQLCWAEGGRYLVVGERRSDELMVFDVRVEGKVVEVLQGRRAMSNQRLGFDVMDAPYGQEVWAGGSDGMVRAWYNIGKIGGEREAEWSWKAHKGRSIELPWCEKRKISLILRCLDPVTSTVVHSSGGVVATCSGQRHYSQDFTSDSSIDSGESEQDFEMDNSLNIWAL